MKRYLIGLFLVLLVAGCQLPDFGQLLEITTTPSSLSGGESSTGGNEYNPKYDFVAPFGAIGSAELTLIAMCTGEGIEGIVNGIDCKIADVNDDGVINQVDWNLVNDFISNNEYYCGDGTCNLAENIRTCPGDCPKDGPLWQSLNGPPGSRVTELIQNPDNEHELYALSVRGIYRSDDKGESWKIIENSNNKEMPGIAVFGDRLFFCGHKYDGVYYYDNEENIIKISDNPCHGLEVRANKLFAFSHSDSIGNIKLFYSDLGSDDFDWHDISPDQSELSQIELPPEDAGFGYSIKVQDIATIGNRIIISVNVDAGGSGEYSMGYIYFSDDFGATWKNSNIPQPGRTLITRIKQDPQDINHVIVLLRHPILHESKYSLSDLIIESRDGGSTWSSFTNINYLSNGVTDMEFVDSKYYITEPYDGRIVKIEGQNYDVIRTPTINEFKNIQFNVDDIIFDIDNPSIVYGKTGIIWELGLIKSEDSMATWKKMDRDILASSPTIIVTSNTNSEAVFTSGNVIQESYRTVDGGKTWKPFTPTFSGDELKIDAHNPNHMILMDETSNIYESYNSGQSFKWITGEFSVAKIFDFEISENENIIYVSNIGLGISKGDGTNGWNSDSWQHMSGSSDYAYDFELDPDNSDIIFASYSPKIFENHASVMKYTPGQEENFGWSEIFRVDDSRGITSLEFDPSDSNTIYVGSVGEKGKLVKSNDKGKFWGRLNGYFTFTTIHAMEIDPNDENTIYAAPWGAGLFKSADGSQSWVKLEGGTEPVFSLAAIRVHPQNSDIIFVTERSKPILLKSNDGGKTWHQEFDLGEEYFRLDTFAFDPNNPEIIYLTAWKIDKGQMMGDIFKYSANEWKKITNGVNKALISIGVDPTDSNTVYIGTHPNGLFKSTNGGNSWESISQLADLPVRDIGFHNGNIYLVTDCSGSSDTPACGVYVSKDSGNTWENIVLESLKSTTVFGISFHGNDLYIATANDAYKHTIGSESWVPLNVPFKETATIAATDNKIYVGTHGGGVYRSNINNIEYWKSQGPYAEIYNIQIKVDPTNSDTIYASSYPGGVFKSTDKGKTWNEKNFALPSFKVIDPTIQGYYSLEIDPNNPEVLYLGIFGKGVYKSTNGAGTWSLLRGENGKNMDIMKKGITKIKVDPTNSNNIYLATNDGVYFSDDGAENWVEISEGLGTLDLKTLEITSQGKVYAGTAGYGVYILDKNLQRWYHLRRTLGLGWWTAWERRIYQFSSLLFDPDIPGKIYLGHFPSGFFISEDNGHSWKDSSLGLGNDGMFSLTMHPNDHNILWAGTYNGVVKSTDKGKTWELKGKQGVEELKEEKAWNDWEKRVGGIIPPEQWPYTVAIDSDNTNVMYISTKNGRNKGFCHRNENAKRGHDRNNFCGIVMKSTDGGETWFEIMGGLDWGSEFYNLLIYPENHNILFLSTNRGVYMSKDAGKSWIPINGGLPSTDNQVRDNVADNLAFTKDNEYLIFGLKSYGAWKADISKIGMGEGAKPCRGKVNNVRSVSKFGKIICKDNSIDSRTATNIVLPENSYHCLTGTYDWRCLGQRYNQASGTCAYTKFEESNHQQHTWVWARNCISSISFDYGGKRYSTKTQARCHDKFNGGATEHCEWGPNADTPPKGDGKDGVCDCNDGNAMNDPDCNDGTNPCGWGGP